MYLEIQGLTWFTLGQDRSIIKLYFFSKLFQLAFFCFESKLLLELQVLGLSSPLFSRYL